MPARTSSDSEIARRGRLVLLLVAAVLALLLTAAGCVGQTTPEASGQLATDGFEAPGAQGSRYLPVSYSSAAGSGLQAEDLDPEDIVAAHEQVLIRLYQDLLPSVVHVRATQQPGTPDHPPVIPGHPDVSPDDYPWDYLVQGEGSGFVWDREGHVVTNNHLVENADRVTIVFSDREEVAAQVVGLDPSSDLAVLKLDEDKEEARPVTLGDSDALQVGQMAVAIGDPFGQHFSMTTGIISAVGRTISGDGVVFSMPGVIQTDASVNPGNSGGPLLDRRGRVIGVNTQIMTRSGFNSGVGFAVPIALVKRVVPALIDEGEYAYSWLGITGATLSPDTAEQMDLPRDTGGALILQVSPDSPADRAGLRPSEDHYTVDRVSYPLGGDVIVGIDGSPIRFMDDLLAFFVGETSPGDRVHLEVIREDGERVTLEVTLGERPRRAGQAPALP